MLSRFVLLALALVLSGCATTSLSTTRVSYLVPGEPEAALDSVAVWATEAGAWGVTRSDDGLSLRDGSADVQVEARPREDGVAEVSVRGQYRFGGGPLGDPGLTIAGGVNERGSRTFLLPLPESPSCFSVEEWRQSPESAPPLDAEADVQEVVETPPVLIGGLAELQRRVPYPESMRRAGISGVVVSQFIVGETGTVECAEVVASPHPEMSAAALGVIREAQFTPGTQGGRPVSVRFTIPIAFRLR